MSDGYYNANTGKYEVTSGGMSETDRQKLNDLSENLAKLTPKIDLLDSSTNGDLTHTLDIDISQYDFIYTASILDRADAPVSETRLFFAKAHNGTWSDAKVGDSTIITIICENYRLKSATYRNWGGIIYGIKL